MVGELVMGIDGSCCCCCCCCCRRRLSRRQQKSTAASAKKIKLLGASVTVLVAPVVVKVTIVYYRTDMDDHMIGNQTVGVFNTTALGEVGVTVWGDTSPGGVAVISTVGSVDNRTVGEDDDSTIVGDVGTVTGGTVCGEWEPAQHNLFQLSNICFAAAFCMPRSFKPSILLLRTLLCIGFMVSAIWAGVHICSPDIFAWNVVLSLTNLIHSVILTFRFLPPALSVELTELYLRLFKPLRVAKKHFKELTREASMLHLARGENYAVEEQTPADERLSILLKGKLRVTCDNMHLHYINCYQFIDSPEWEASHETSDELFQVTITAEEDCIYLCWPKLRLDRVLRHRPMLQTILSNLIGKDITQKLYSLNEQLGNVFTLSELSKSNQMSDHWRHVMTRSLSVDAVDTGTRGHVRSTAWRTSQKNERRNSDAESPSRGQQCWIPVVANHFPPTSPFAAAVQQTSSSHTSYAPPPPPCLPSAAASAAITATSQQPPVALIPVIVPVIAPPPVNTAPSRPGRPRLREVKFDESKV